MRAPRKHHVSIASLYDLKSFANCLRARGTRGHAVVRRPATTEELRQPIQGKKRFLLAIDFDGVTLHHQGGPLLIRK
jgi:hypothetical protein